MGSSLMIKYKKYYYKIRIKYRQVRNVLSSLLFSVNKIQNNKFTIETFIYLNGIDDAECRKHVRQFTSKRNGYLSAILFT